MKALDCSIKKCSFASGMPCRSSLLTSKAFPQACLLVFLWGISLCTFLFKCSAGLWAVLLHPPQSCWGWRDSGGNAAAGVSLKGSLLPGEDLGDAERTEAEPGCGHEHTGREREADRRGAGPEGGKQAPCEKSGGKRNKIKSVRGAILSQTHLKPMLALFLQF